ncbi:MAG: hypothetical protein M1372_01105 [Patescibacteria group bacterium]|nr:hypothetical protein [Patescibacteria group bacterium]
MRQKIIRRNKKFPSRVVIICLFLIASVCIILYLYLSFFKKPFIVSPLGKSNTKDIDIANLLYKENIPFASVSIASDSSFTVNLLGGGEVMLSSKKDITTQISTLQLILKRLTIEGKKIKILDFRFDKTILKL